MNNFFGINNELPEWDLTSGVEKMRPRMTSGSNDPADNSSGGVRNTGNELIDGALGGHQLFKALGVTGPWGAAIGAVASGVMGGLKMRARRKAQNRQATADMYNQQAQIEGQTQANRQAALGGLASRLSNALR